MLVTSEKIDKRDYMQMRHSAPEEILIRRDASRRHGETASRHLRQAQPARARASSFLQVTREQQPDRGNQQNA